MYDKPNYETDDQLTSTAGGSPRVATAEDQLNHANECIEKLKCELKEKYAAIEYHAEKCRFYEQLIKNLTTFN